MKVEVLHYSHMPEPGDLLFSEDLSGDIEMGTWEKGAGSLLSLAASTCIILAAHNDETKFGLLGHFSSIAEEGGDGYSDKESFRQAVAAISSLGNPGETSVWLGGGTSHVWEGEDETEEDRLYAEKNVREHAAELRVHGDQVKAEWSAAKCVIDVELDCVSGILAVHSYPKEAVSTAAAAFLR